ncbi:arginine N-succinyltransferase [Chromobacterium vaccinii]|uniref:Arginine N-succinyltransferase n=1 Tax=Chromobacterium indicum TaxID=3110228 RepID=A0ABV0CNE9_9NEIS|nr:arginine N-succinyltransferase [Chromobacterium vaccinii]AVG16505.1 arginine N-succinyltransferase [Chromobacterium vaccinii]MCD4485623.1 arginine N-succinyltransferase [Chromobacterium vaccinii]MCD4501706.1 arginine N-succinyltransferase [Chromobacterium vaccinii]
MMFIRPVEHKDLPGLMELARSAASGGVGLTSLPINEDRLQKRIARSVLSFSGELDRADHGYVFVLEDSENGKVAGICAVEAAVGLKEPWYNYRIGTIVHASEELGVYSRHETLFLSNDHTGYSELCTLYLHPDYRVKRNGGLLSKSRFLFLAQFPQLFGKMVVAEMRGVSDETGRSPFWEALGRHFFSIDFAEADYLTGIGQKAFVAELMPKHPVYVDFLEPEAQAVIGLTHEATRPAVAMLESEGFRYEGYVDIFDAGPTVQAYTGDIRAVKESQRLPARVVDPLPDGDKECYLVCNDALQDYRAVLVESARPQGEFCLTPELAQALKIKDGDHVRCVTLTPKEAAQ